MEEDFLIINDKLLEKINSAILQRGFTGNIRFKKNKVILREKNEKDFILNEEVFFERINTYIFAVNDAINKHRKSNDIERLAKIRGNFCLLIIMCERAERFFNNKGSRYNELKKEIRNICGSLKERLGEDYPELMSIALYKSEEKENMIKQSLDIRKMDSSDIIFIIDNYIGKEEFLKNIDVYIQVLYSNPEVIEQLEKKGYLSPEEVNLSINERDLINLFKQKNSKYIFRYLYKKDIYNFFLKGYFDKKDLASNTKFEDLFEQGFSKETIMEILQQKPYKTEATKIIWELFEKDFFDNSDLMQIYKLNYINPNEIAKTYLEEHKRKIAQELKVTSISDKKIFEFFTPQMVLELNKINEEPENSKQNQKKSKKQTTEPDKNSVLNETEKFYKEDLRLIYKEQGRDLQRELINKQKEIIKLQQNDSTKPNNLSLLNLYKSGLVELNKFEPGELSDEEIINFYNEQKDDNIIIQTFNKGLLSQEEVLTLFEEEKLFEAINKGLNARVLQGYYETVNFLEFYKSGILKPEKLYELKDYLDFEYITDAFITDELTIKELFDLYTKSGISELKTCFDIQKITEAYKSNELTYEDLFNVLVKNGIIDTKTAETINEQYDIECALEKLRKKGIFGQDIELARSVQDNGFNQDNINCAVNSELSNNTQKKEYQPFARNNDLSNQLFNSLGAGEKVRVNCPLFDGYVMIPFVDKKLAILEGDGRTYMMPLKIVLEQVENRGSKEDLIGNAVYRSDLYTNTEYVRTANHTANWGRNIIKRMAELKPAIDAKKLIMENEELLAKLEQQYKDKKKGISR